MKLSGIFAFLLLVPICVLGQTEDLAEKSVQARQMMAAGKFSEAAAIYEELNQKVTGNPGLLLNLGMALQMSGEDQKAIPHLEAALKLDPKLTPAWLFLGRARLHTGRTASAIPALQQVLQLESGHTAAREMLAGALLSTDRPAEAAGEYRKLADASPQNATAWFGLGRSYETLSVRAYSALEKKAPDSAYWILLTAESRLREQQFSSAFYLYRQALQRMPSMPGIHAALAQIYRQTEHPEWAAQEEQQEKKLMPDCSVKSNICLFNTGRYSDLLAAVKGTSPAESLYWTARSYNQLAVQAFGRLGELPPSSEQHQLKARIYGNQRRYSEAASEWKAALALSSGNSEIQEQLGLSLKFAQEYAAALPVFKELLRRQPASSEYNYLVGDTLLDLQQPEEAIPFLQRAVRKSPQMQAAHKSLARAELAVDKPAEAIPHLKAVLATDKDGSIHFQLANAYQALGQSELAKPILEEYRRLQQARAAETSAAQQEIAITAPQ